jgi:Fe(3+) dicitrate transport protein
VGYAPTASVYLFADAQRSLRAPQVTQIIYGNNLNSELAWNYEVGGRWMPDRHTTISLTAYRIDFNNQIQLDNTSRNYVNLGATRNPGDRTVRPMEPGLSAAPDIECGLDLSGCRAAHGHLCRAARALCLSPSGQRRVAL